MYNINDTLSVRLSIQGLLSMIFQHKTDYLTQSPVLYAVIGVTFVQQV
jgi:peptide deformylase